MLVTSSMAPNAVAGHAAITQWLSNATGIRLDFMEEGTWDQREALLYQGSVHIGFICGLPYVRQADAPNPPLRLLGAPVMAARRYQDRPIYFSDVVVRADSPLLAMVDLEGLPWAYNEPNSQSGHNVTQYHLALQQRSWRYFGRIVASGGHLDSLRMLLDGDVDATAIDSTVLETELQISPGLEKELRIIDTFGPSPIPPIVISRSVPDIDFEQLQRALLHMHEDSAGQAILANSNMRRIARVTDVDYDPIRDMIKVVEGIRCHLAA